MSQNKFSIVIPVYSGSIHNEQHDRSKTVQRAIKSVINQQYPYWELILVDDGAADGVTPKILDMFAEKDERIKVIHKENEARAIARNTGMDAATGDWICWLDSDDEYLSHYLRELDQAIKDFPDYKIFNFASLVNYQDHHTLVRPTFTPAEEGEGHEWFRSGHIGAGSFIFNRELWNSDKKYRIPDEVNPFQFASQSKFPWKLTREEDEWKYDNTENPDTMFNDGVYRQGSSLGNPWGDDFLQFYYLTRDNKSKALDVILYNQYVRSQEEIYDHYGEIYDPKEYEDAK